MKNNIFRPVSIWKSAIMLLPDNSFFELLRSVFGTIKTPFNKQQLVNDLEAFFLRQDIQQAVYSYIDETDAKIITSIAVLNEPSQKDLEHFFEGEFNDAQLSDIIVNLEERFILYRIEEIKEPNKTFSDTKVFSLNPVLKKILLPIVSDTSKLFSFYPIPQKTAKSLSPQQIIDDRLLAALYSFASCVDPFFKEDDICHRKTINMAKTIFPNIKLQEVIGSLQILGLFFRDDTSLVPDKKRFDDFGAAAYSELTAIDRKIYIAAAMFVYNQYKPSFDLLPPLFKTRIKETACFISEFLAIIKPQRLYPQDTLYKYFLYLEKKLKVKYYSLDTLLDILERTDLLLQYENKTWAAKIHETNPANDNLSETNNSVPVIANDSGFSFIVYPEISFADAVALASILKICETGSIVRFEIDKNFAIRAFDNKITANTIIELLNRLSCNRINETVFWNFTDWEKRYGKVSLKKGIILTLSKEYQYLLDTKKLAGLIIETLAPGIYLLPENSLKEATEALQNAGADIVLQPQRILPGSVHVTNQYPKISAAEPHIEKLETPGSKPFKEAQDDLKAVFHTVLDSTKKDKSIKAELAARIDRKMILCEAQIKEAIIPYEKLEAKLLDYSGKVNIAKLALQQRDPLEVVFLENKDTEKHLFGIPVLLMKDKNDKLNLTLNCEDTYHKIPISKISLLRRIKKSIFA